MTIFTPISSSPFKMVMGHPFVAPAYTNLITRLGSHGAFTRGSTATMWSNGKLVSAGVNIARFDTDPITGDYKGLLIEEARSNLEADSTTVSGWSNNGVTKTNNALVSPDGGTNATQLDMTASSSSGIYDFVAVAAETTYTLSYFVKHISGDTLIDISSDTTSVWGNAIYYKATFNTSTQAFTNVGAAVTDYGYETMPNGWYRIWITGDTIAGATASSSITIYNGGVLVSSFGIWGVQFEQGAFPTSYIPTAGATATRSADLATVPVTAFDFNPLQGTIYADAHSLNNPQTLKFRRVFSFDDGTLANRIGLNRSSGNLQAFLTKISTVQSDFVVGAWADDTSTKMSIAYKVNDIAVSLAGATVSTDFTADIPVGITTLRIGTDSINRVLNGHIKELRYYPTRLANGQLESMTS